MKGRDVTERLDGYRCPHYSSFTMELVPKKEFFLQWRIAGDRIAVRTSDYLEDAPDTTLREIAGTVCSRISGRRANLPDSFFDYVRNDDFITDNRPIYIDRSRNLTGYDIGNVCDIQDSIDRLEAAGLITQSDIRNSFFSWTTRMNKQRMGFCSTMFRVVGISSVLDSEEVPEFVRDYVVYHEILHLRQTFRIPHNAHDCEFRGWEHLYPQWREAEKYLPRFYLENSFLDP